MSQAKHVSAWQSPSHCILQAKHVLQPETKNIFWNARNVCQNLKHTSTYLKSTKQKEIHVKPTATATQSPTLEYIQCCCYWAMKVPVRFNQASHVHKGERVEKKPSTTWARLENTSNAPSKYAKRTTGLQTAFKT